MKYFVEQRRGFFKSANKLVFEVGSSASSNFVKLV